MFVICECGTKNWITSENVLKKSFICYDCHIKNILDVRTRKGVYE